MIDLSILIVSYNTRDLTLQAIDAVKRSKTKVNYQIIVVDNGSVDGSVESLKKLGKKIVLIQNKGNLGFAAANNQAIEKASGRHVLLLNSDTKVKVGAIDKLVEFADKSEQAGVVGAKLLNTDGSVQSSVYHFPTFSRALRQYFWDGAKYFEKYYPKKSMEVEAVVGAVFLITARALRRVGRLSEKYFMYFEDIDYCRRVHEAGLKVYYLAEAEVVHYHGASGGGNGAVDKYLVESSRKYHGLVNYYLITFALWSGQKLKRIFG